MGAILNNKNLLITVSICAVLTQSAESGSTSRAIVTVNRKTCISHAHALLGRRSPTAIENDLSGIEQFILRRVSQSYRRSGSAKLMTAITRVIIEESNRHGFDPMVILAVIEHESGFDPNARGPYGEIGLMQIKPSTARWIRDKLQSGRPSPIELTNPIENIRLGTAYLAFLKSKLKRAKAMHYLNAYNMGLSNLRRILSQRIQPTIYSDRILRKYVRLHGELKQVNWRLARN